MSEQECPHGDHPSCCIDCMAGPPPERPNRPKAPAKTQSSKKSDDTVIDAKGYTKAVMFLWSPDGYGFHDIADIERRTSNGETFEYTWSLGSRTNYLVGERFYLLRSGRDHAIIGAGKVTALPFKDEHWEEPDRSEWYVRIEFDGFSQAGLSTDVLEASFGDVHWRIQSSGKRIENRDVIDGVEKLWAEHLKEVSRR